MTEKLKNKINDEQLKIRAISDEKITVKLTNNYAFQKIFKNEEIVKGFLMALLHLKETDIETLEVADPFVEGEVKEEKEGILDVKMVLNGGKKINIEMQNTYQEDWAERSLFYNCRMFTEGLYHGQPYGDLEPCIHVGILDFDLMKTPGFHHHIKLLDIKTNEEYSSKLQFHVVQLKQVESATEEEKQTELYYWAKLLAAKDWKQVEETIRGNPYREAVKNEMYKMSQDEKERYLYLREEMAVSDEVSRMRTAKDEGIQLAKKVFKLSQKGYTAAQIAEECNIEESEVKEILA